MGDTNMKKLIKAGTIVDNKLSNGSVIRCKVIGIIEHGGQFMGYRVCDAREYQTGEWLIRNNKTWLAPVENLKVIGTYRLYFWNWVGGGYNTCLALSKKEALEIAREKGAPSLKVSVGTLVSGKKAQRQSDKHDKMYVGMFD